MVEYVDGSVLAQMGTPDMKTPIAVALAWPRRIASGASQLDFRALSELTFEEPDTGRFPCLRLAREALRQGGSATAVLNAANEEAVQAFLDGRLAFNGIAQLVEQAMESVPAPACTELDAVLEVDRQARAFARSRLQGGA